MDYTGKPYTLKQFMDFIESQEVTPNSIQEKVFNNGKSILGYRWTDGDKNSFVVDIILYKGKCILGDLKLMFHGTFNHYKSGYKGYRNLVIRKNTSLIITDKDEATTYIDPTLYIGAGVGDNIKTVASIIKRR